MTPKFARKSLTTTMYSAGRQVIDPAPWMEDFWRTVPEVRHKWATHWLTHTATNLDRLWPRVYELLNAVREQETWKQTDATSFEAYVERMLGKPFATFEDLEHTYHFARIARPELFTETFDTAKAATKTHQTAMLAASQTNKDNVLVRGRHRQFADDAQPDRAERSGVSVRTQRMLDKLSRKAPDVFAELKAGTYRSVYAAARAAGLVKTKTPLDQLRHWWRKASVDERRIFLTETHER